MIFLIVCKNTAANIHLFSKKNIKLKFSVDVEHIERLFNSMYDNIFIFNY